MISKTSHLIIVGAGIVGASIAYHLARKNVHVTLMDRAPEPAQDVTGKSFAWITAAYDAPEAYFNLRSQAFADWHRVESELKGKFKSNWSGALSWYKNMAEAERIVRKLSGFGYKLRLIDLQEIRHLEPNLKIVPDQGMFAENEGAIDPVLTTQLLVKAAREAGVIIHIDTEVMTLMTNGSRIIGVVTETGNIVADLVVLAAGTGTAKLCEPLGLKLPVNISPAILMKFDTHHRFVNRIVSNPFMEIRAASDRLTLAIEDYVDESVENNPQAIAGRTLEATKRHRQGVLSKSNLLVSW